MARVEPAINSGGLLKLYQALWAPYYDAVLRILGSTGVILPIGDPHHGQPDATSFTTKGEEQVAFTWSEAPSAFDSALDLTEPDAFQGIVPVVVLNGSDEEADTPDAAYWSRVAGAFSVGLWVDMTTVTGGQYFLAKYATLTATPEREWRFWLDGSSLPTFEVWDQSASANIGRQDGTALVTDSWHHLVGTYDGGSASSGISVYLDGIAVDDTDSETGTFVNTEDLTVKPSLAHFIASGGSGSNFFDGKMAGGPLGPCFTQKELTADEVRALYDLGRAALAL